MIMQKNDRDCLICCLSELLDIDYDLIPKFYKMYPKDLNKECESIDNKFRIEFDKWLNVNGYTRIMIDIQVENKTIKIPYVSNRIRCLGILKKKDRVYFHIVLLSIKDDTLRIIHDPKQNSDYELSDITGIEFIIKK